MSDYLPPEEWTLIFTKFLSKTLLRCTTVCKSFHRLITPDFIKSHLSVQKPQGLFLVRSYKKRGDEVYSLHYDDDKLTKYASITVPYPHVDPEHYRIVGCCRGILCLSDEHLLSRESKMNVAFLCNPAIRKWLQLQIPQSHSFTPDYSFNHGLIGFGFDATSNDYKVVRIASYLDTRWPAKAYVYSLSSDTWRNVSSLCLNLELVIHPYTPQAYINGAVHWLVSDESAKRNLILSFNMSSELFQVIELPDTVPYVSGNVTVSELSLAVIEGSLSLVKRTYRRCSVWLMKENGVSTLWTKKVDFEFARPVSRLLGCRMNGEFIFDREGSLHSYDPGVMGVRDCVVDKEISPLVSVTRYRDSSETCDVYLESYTDSLALLGMQTQVEEEEETDSEEEEEVDEDEANLRNLKGKIKSEIGLLLKSHSIRRKLRKH